MYIKFATTWKKKKKKKKKNDLHSFSIFQYIYSQRRGYLKAWKTVFVKTPIQSSCSYLRKSFFLIGIQIDFGKVVFIVIWDLEDSLLTHWLGMTSIMQLYENQTILCCVFTKFLKYTLNFEHSEKMSLVSLVFCNFFTLKDIAT